MTIGMVLDEMDREGLNVKGFKKLRWWRLMLHAEQHHGSSSGSGVPMKMSWWERILYKFLVKI